MEDISSLRSADRVEIFRHLADDGNDGIDANILNSIACDNFHSFIDFCDKVFAEKDRIKDISATINENDQLEFNISYKN